MDIMIDLETMGLQPSAPIMAIGACVVGRDMDLYYYARTEPEGVAEFGTIAWWLKQAQENPEAATEIIKAIEEGEDLTGCLYGLNDFMNRVSMSEQVHTDDIRVWSKGANFDIVMLEAAMTKRNVNWKWNYKNVRCFRTIDAHFGKDVPPPMELDGTGVAHQALDDARWQARKLDAIIQANMDNPHFKL